MEIRMAVPSNGASFKELMKSVFNEAPLIRWFILGDGRHARTMETFYAFMVERYCMPRGLVWVTEDLRGAALSITRPRTNTSPASACRSPYADRAWDRPGENPGLAHVARPANGITEPPRPEYSLTIKLYSHIL
jgi:hypothetical protein